jgi:hypothetical protein
MRRGLTFIQAPRSRRTLLLALTLVAPAAAITLPSAAADMELERAPGAQSLTSAPAGDAPVAVPPLTASSQEPATIANPLWAIPLATMSTTRDRPLFSPSRRPPPPIETPVAAVRAPPPPPPPRVEPPPLSLVGTVSGDDESFAIFVDQTTRTALRLRLGENYEGWWLRSVQNREVALEREQQTTILSLPDPGDGNTAISSPTPVPPAPAPMASIPAPVVNASRPRDRPKPHLMQ